MDEFLKSEQLIAEVHKYYEKQRGIEQLLEQGKEDNVRFIMKKILLDWAESQVIDRRNRLRAKRVSEVKKNTNLKIPMRVRE